MKNAIGKELSFEEVKKLEDGTKVYIETVYPIEHCFLGVKDGVYIKSSDGEIKWAIAEDFKVLCKAYEWKPKKELTNLERLLSNIKIYIAAGVLEEEFAVFNSEYGDIDSISELNDIMEDEMSYWES